MKKVNKLTILGLLVVFLMLIFSGCTRRLVDFTVISSKNVNMKVKDTGKGNRVVGKDQVYWFITIPLGSPNLKEAIDRAIESAGPNFDALVDGVVYSYSYWYILSGVTGFKVEGTPIKTTELISELKENGEDIDLAMQNVLYHSSLDISNDLALKNIPVIKLTDKEMHIIAKEQEQKNQTNRVAE